MGISAGVADVVGGMGAADAVGAVGGGAILDGMAGPALAGAGAGAAGGLASLPSWVSPASNIVGSLISGTAATGAAKTQANAADAASQAQLGMYAQTANNVAPWLDAGQSSLKDLMTGIQPGGQFAQTPYTPFTDAQFKQDPGEQFQLQQGQNAIMNGMSKSGGPNSNNMKGLMSFSQGLANTDYQQALNNYVSQFQLANQTKQQNFANEAGISSGGLGAGLQQGQISANVGQSVGSNMIGAGNAQAAGQVGVANAVTGGLSSAYNQYVQQQFLQAMQQPQNNQQQAYAG